MVQTSFLFEIQMSTSYKRLSFTNREEENLIEFIKQHPALWDSNHSEYVNGELRKIYWMSIAAELNKSVTECRRKWRFIRDYYIHKRRRLSDSTPQRDGKYFSLHFLDKIAVRRFTNLQNQNSHTSYTRQNRNEKFNVKSIERLGKIEADLEDSELEYTLGSDVTFEKVTMERVDQGHNYMCDDEDGRTNPDLDGNDETVCDDDFNIDESSMVHEFGVEQKLEGNDEEEMNQEHYVDSSEPGKEQGNVLMRDKAIDLFFESMAAAVKTFPAKYVTEAKFKVFSAINELEMKVQSDLNGK